MRYLPAAAIMLVLSGPAFAGPPSDAVRYFYRNIGSETEPDNRDRFTGLARAALDANERVANGGGEGGIVREPEIAAEPDDRSAHASCFASVACVFFGRFATTSSYERRT